MGQSPHSSGPASEPKHISVRIKHASAANGMDRLRRAYALVLRSHHNDATAVATPDDNPVEEASDRAATNHQDPAYAGDTQIERD